ncbi:MAG TPA: PD-(D/E)XK nuclease family protein [bacterium]|nr:PD-(D/E)XK nuclease family protein [bacterium]HPN30590.1 PD-(D/E)XK nuclease family protein [bacterium]
MILIVFPDNYTLNRNLKKNLHNTGGRIFANRLLNLEGNDINPENYGFRKIFFKPSGSGINQGYIYTTLARLKNHIKSESEIKSPVITDFMSRLIIGNILNILNEKSKLKYFKKIYGFGSFNDSIKNFIYTLNRNGISSSELKKISPDNQKFRELHRIFDSYTQFLDSQNIRDESQTDFEIVRLISNKFNQIDLFKNVDSIIVKYIYNFDGLDFRIFYEIAKKIKVNIEFPLPDRQTASSYEFIEKNITKFECLGDSGAGINLVFEDFENSGNIQLYADNLFSGEKKINADNADAIAESVSICKCGTSAMEIDYIANQIRGLLKKNINPENICVYCSSTDAYMRRIENIFEKYKLPNKHKSTVLLKDISVIKFIAFAYKTVINGYLSKSVRGVLMNSYSVKLFESQEEKNEFRREFDDFIEKNNLIELRPDSVKKLFNRDFFKSKYKKLGILQKLLNALEPLDSKNPAHIHIENFFKLTDFFGLNSRTSDYYAIDKTFARDRSGLKLLSEILKELEIFSGKLNVQYQMELFDFSRFLGEICSVYSIKNFDISASATPILDLSKSAGREFDYVFIAGMNSRHIPAKLYYDSLITDFEKNILNKNYLETIVKNEALEKGIILFETAKNKVIEDKYSFYAASRAAKNKLCYAYSSIDESGGQDSPSIYINEAKSILSLSKNFKIIDYDSIFRQNFSDLNNPEHLLLKIFSGFFRRFENNNFNNCESKLKNGGLKKIFKQVEYSELFSLNEFKNVFRIYSVENKRAAFFSDAENSERGFFSGILDPNLKIYTNKKFSATKLELYANCPFKFFCAECLKLNFKEIPEDSVENSKIGEVIHSILENFLKNFNSIFFPELNALLESAEKKLDELLISYKTLDVKIANLIKKFYLAYLTKFYNFETGLFYKKKYDKVNVEYIFDDLKIGDSLFKGKIDRMDFFPNGEIRLIDYKISSKTRVAGFKKNSAYGITHLQAPLYFLAVKSAFPKNEISPDSGFYLINENPEIIKAPLILTEPVENRLCELTNRIKANDFRIKPEDCSYCDFSKACRYKFYE